jgi:hypothetical protein
MSAIYLGCNGFQSCILPPSSSSISPLLASALLGGNGGPEESSDLAVGVVAAEPSVCKFPTRLGWTGGGRTFFAVPAALAASRTLAKLPVELAVFVLVGRSGLELERVRDTASCEIAAAGFDVESLVRDRFLALSPSICGTDVWLGLEASDAGFKGFGGGAFFEIELVVVVEDTLPVLPAARTGSAGAGVAVLDSAESSPALPSLPDGRLPSQEGTTIVLRGGGGSGFGLPLLFTP